MPGFDGTGPMGRGPVTGGGFGYCPPAYSYTGNPSPVYGYGAYHPYGRHPIGLESMRGWGRGRGRRGCRRWWW